MSSSDPPGKPVRDYLHDWPYVSHYLQATLDPDLIATHGKALLLRTLNTGNAVCFVGSGVSMSYGRLGWGDLVRKLAGERRKTTDGSPAMVRNLCRWLDELNLEKRPHGDRLESGRYPAAFQFAELLSPYLKRPDVVEPDEAAAKEEFRKRVRELLFDDCGHGYFLDLGLLRDQAAIKDRRLGRKSRPAAQPSHAEQMLEQTYAFEGRRYTRACIEDESGGISTPNAGGGWRARMALDAAALRRGHRVLARRPGDRRWVLAGPLLAELEAVVTRSPAGPTIPLHRFVAVALRRLGDDVVRRPASQRGTTSQGSGMTPLPAHADPLLLLAAGLGVRRFITTNYDMDIERLLINRGFRLDDRRDGLGRRTDQSVSINALGARSLDGLYRPDRAVDLIDFSINAGNHVYTVAHLHGRATEGDGMIITDRDYLEQYLGRGEDVDVSNDAISLAFGSNPLIFVGSGMSEDDVLRPLRQFVAERKSRVDRRAVVLLPADGSRAKEVEDVIALYSRYGVYTVHFGVGNDGRDVSEQDRPDIRWLACFKYVVATASAILTDFKSAIEAVDSDAESAVEVRDRHLRGIRRTIESFNLKPLAVEATNGEGDIVPKIPSLAESVEDGPWPRLKLPARIDKGCREALPPASGAVELACLNAVLHFVFDIALVHVKNAERDAIASQTSPGTLDVPRLWFGFDTNPARVGARREVVRDALALDGDGADQAQLLRVVLAYLAIADGLSAALSGLALNARLLALRSGVTEWKQARRPYPVARRPGGPGSVVQPWRPGKDVPDASAPLLLRHPLALRESPRLRKSDSANKQDRAPGTDRFFSDAPSQTFQALLSAIREELHTSPLPGREVDTTNRRLFVLFADRGVGKGHFFEALRTPARLGQFIEWSWPQGASVSYAAFAYFNFSFSLEIVSAFDRIADLLVNEATNVFPGSGAICEEITRAGRTLAENRIAKLAALVRLYARHGEHARARLLIAISPFNLLFDERGDPKNAEIYRLVGILLGDDGAHAPIDWFLVCSGAPFPGPFAKPDPLRRPLDNASLDGWSGKMPRIALQHLVRPDISEKGRRRVENTLQRFRVNLTEQSAAGISARRRRRTAPAGAVAYFHVLRDARTSNTVAKYFPEVALALACRPGLLNRAPSPESTVVPRLPLQSRECLETLRRRILVWSFKLERSVPSLLSPKARGQVTVLAAMGTIAKAIANRSGDLTIQPGQFYREIARTVRTESVTAKSAEVDDLADRDYRTLLRALGRSRFLVTLACAAASEVAFDDGESHTVTSAELRVDSVVGWWQALLDHLSSLQADDKQDRVVDYVLEHYQSGHDLRRSLPIATGAPAGQQGRDLEAALRGPAGWVLQQRILWHLAVVGHPIEADVLATAPLLNADCFTLSREAFGEKLAKERNSLDFRLRAIKCMLDVLVRRCLVFRLHSAKVHESASDAFDKSENLVGPWRYTVHRFVQRAIFRKLHAPHVEHPSVDPYGLSMWATQPDDLPRPNRAAALKIAELLADWTGFPQDSRHVMRESAFHRALAAATTARPNVAASTERDAATVRGVMTLAARMLRASLGVVRTVYSVGVVARFHDFADASDAAALQGPEEGFFEQHRLQIRWMIERARDLPLQKSLADVRLPGKDGLLGELIDLSEARAPFFAEEIVWLYNECGLFCLVEGRLGSSAGLFALALRGVAGLEAGDRHGALWCRVNLNLAVVDIERGRIREARKNLTAILQVEDENPILRLLAQGYLALVEHYSGNSAGAEKTFQSVIRDLDGYEQSRSVAIFSRHLADLYRLRGVSATNDAVLAIDRAIAVATKGGHEDLRQMCKLSRVRLAIDGLLRDEEPLIQQRLDEIERYGVDMGMPRLVADATYARAAHLLRLGETRHAARLARDCLELAIAHDLKLRQMTALALLGRIHEKRGLPSAKRLKDRASSLAESCDYSNVRDGTRRQTPL